MSSLYESLVIVSEKAANIARVCRQDKHLFELLVEEKGSLETNPRFVRDFKTLADVLIQETVRHDIGQQFPEIKDHIKGEENNAFTNTLGETIYVEVLATVNETSQRLEKVLTGDLQAARILAEEVHRKVSLNEVNCPQFEDDENWNELDYDYNKLGIWIDPIDSTAEYINGQEVIDGSSGIVVAGLKCVTVLLGVYDSVTGVPVLGVINQPFLEFDEVHQRWKGHCYVGYKSSGSISNNPTSPTNLICLSTSEDGNIKKKLKDRGFILVEAAGAGYKILLVINGLANAYVLSKGTTFKWDTCGPQAILKSLGGDLLKFDDALNMRQVPITYCIENTSENKIVSCCNYGGIVAYRDKQVYTKIIEALTSE